MWRQTDRTREFEAAGLLDGLDDGARDARVRLLQDLAAEGVSIEEMRVALAEGRLAAPGRAHTGGGAAASGRSQ